jgi:hypothetical protein
MGEDMEQQVNAIFQPKAKVYCGNCFYYVPDSVTKYGILEARCRHANARYMQETFEGLHIISIPPEKRNEQNNCKDWTRQTFLSDLDHNPLKLLMVILAALFLMVTVVKVLLP